MHQGMKIQISFNFSISNGCAYSLQYLLFIHKLRLSFGAILKQTSLHGCNAEVQDPSYSRSL